MTYAITLYWAKEARVRPLFVSPHADDICFSMLGTLAAMDADGVLATVFSKSCWAEPDWEGPRGPEDVTDARRREDQAFCSAYALSYKPLAFEDSSIRHSLQGNLRRPSGDEALLQGLVAESLGGVIEGEAIDVLFAPLALGHHVDHQVARDAAMTAARAVGIPVAYYEDVPYAAESSLRALARASKRVSRRLEPVICLAPLTPQEKRSVAETYASQRKAEILDAIVSHSARLARRAGAGTRTGRGVAERVWIDGGETALREVVGPGAELVPDQASIWAGLMHRRWATTS